MQIGVDALDRSFCFSQVKTRSEAPSKSIAGPIDPRTDADDVSAQLTVGDVPAASKLAMNVFGDQHVAELTWADIGVVVVPNHELASAGEIKKELRTGKSMSNGNGVTEGFNWHQAIVSRLNTCPQEIHTETGFPGSLVCCRPAGDDQPIAP